MISTPYTVLLGTAVIAYFILWPVVRYFRDPKRLRRFHNFAPFSGISSLPFMILAHFGFRSNYLVQRHKEHTVLRTGPNSLSYSSAQAIKDIYGHTSKCTKDDSYLVTSGTHFHLADVISKPDHARKRKVLSSAYAIKNLEQWEHKVADKTIRMLRHFDKCCTSPLPTTATHPHPSDLTLDYRAWTNFFTLDAIADIGLSEPLGFLDAGNDSITVRRPNGSTYVCNFRECLYSSAHKQSLLLWPYTWYKTLNKLSNIIPFYNHLGQLAESWDGIPIELAQRRLDRYRKGEKLDDFFQALMEDKAGNFNNLEWGEIVAEVSIMMNAGSATTAIAMTNVLYQLLKNPDKLAKLREELDSALDDLDEEDEDESAPNYAVEYDRVKHLPYLRACLDESLRIFPPTSHGLPRNTPTEGASIDGHFIPGNTSVSISALVAHRNEQIFPNADQYIPERWLGEEGKNLQPYFLAFSAGARGCIGRNISYLEQTVVLASVLRRYDFALPSAGWELKRLETMNLLVGEMPVKVWRRERGGKGNTEA